MSNTLLEDAVNGRIDWNTGQAELIMISVAISAKRSADALALIAKHLEPVKIEQAEPLLPPLAQPPNSDQNR